MEQSTALVIPILTYHQVAPLITRQIRQPGLIVSESSFRWQIFILRALGYRSLLLDEIADALLFKCALAQRHVAITFDDGYAGIFDHAFPILRNNGFTATLFLIAEDFANAPATTARSFPVVTRAQVSEMLGSGFRVGSHSVTHARLTDLPRTQAQTEMMQSKQLLEDAFRSPVSAFSYPYGSYDRELEMWAEEAGYRCAVTTRFGRHQNVNERFALRRIPVGSAQRLPHFVYRLLWAREE